MNLIVVKKLLVGLSIAIFVVCSDPGSMVLAQTFKNCSEVNRTYRWGVAKSIAAAKIQKNYPINNPLVSEAIYKSIAKMDRDKDGTACEK
jgi:hypothetical protein